MKNNNDEKFTLLDKIICILILIMAIILLLPYFGVYI